MRAWVAAAAVLVGLGWNGHAGADETTERAIAREVVEIAGSGEVMGALVDAMTPMLVQQLTAGGQLSADQAQRFVAIFGEEFRADIPRMLDMAAGLCRPIQRGRTH